jgi:hypothetical protein
MHELGIFADIKSLKMEFLKDLWMYLKERKKWWLLPVIIILLFFGILIVLSSGSAIAPFIYTIF